METNNHGMAIKRSFWGALAFYLLIAFEFFYMAGPFAAYFYSVYAPVLNFLNQSPALSWLSSFFLPHVVEETSSVFINFLLTARYVLAIAGFLAFCVGAIQVYYHKFARKGIVTGGIYNHVRHPQYASFIVCSFGLLLVWPRYIVAIMFVTMVFFYYLLAKAEEAECERKFGKSYTDFKNRTGMFLPFRLSLLPELPKQKSKKIIVLIGVYFIAIVAIMGFAWGLNRMTIESLYTANAENSVTVSLCKLSDENIEKAMSIVLADEAVKNKTGGFNSGEKYLNYILPAEWYPAEVPMNKIERVRGHYSPAAYNQDLYKIILTKAYLRDGVTAVGKEILTSVYLREPIAEVWINLSANAVVKILDMPEEIMYKGIPVSVF